MIANGEAYSVLVNGSVWAVVCYKGSAQSIANRLRAEKPGASIMVVPGDARNVADAQMEAIESTLAIFRSPKSTYRPTDAAQAEQCAHTYWANNCDIRKAFPSRQEFASQVARAWFVCNYN